MVVLDSNVGIFQLIRQCDPPIALRGLNQYLSSCARITETEVSSSFIKSCIEQRRFPKHYTKLLKRHHTVVNIKTLKRHALNELDTIDSLLCRLRHDATHREDYLDVLPLNLRMQFEEYVADVCRKRGEKKLIKLQRSLDKRVPQSSFPQDPNRYVHNFSNVTLDQTQLEVLSLGIKFCDSRSQDNRLDIETSFENVLPQTRGLQANSQIELEALKACLVNASYQFRRTNPTVNSLVTRRHREALKGLKNNKNLIMSKPDKGSGIVLLNREDYISKMNDILQDETKFQLLATNNHTTQQTEKQLNIFLKKLKEEHWIDKQLFDEIKPSGSYLPRIYGLPKVHKPGIPLRPILDMCNSPHHAVAKWLCTILQPVHKHLVKHSARDTFDCIERISNQVLIGKKMLSLDVTSLFTNVPLMETVDYICQIIERDNLQIDLPKPYIKELLLRCTMNVNFLFNGLIYRQIDGVAMGSPLGPRLANIFMSKLENTILHEEISEFSLYMRYMDDTLLFFDENKSISEILEVLIPR